MDKDQVAAILSEIGTLLELQGENSFRVNAYYNGARAIQQLEEDLGEVVRQGRLTAIPGIGATLRDKITTLVTTGRLPFYEDLKARIPPGVVQMLREGLNIGGITDNIQVVARHVNIERDGPCQHRIEGAEERKDPERFQGVIGRSLCRRAVEEVRRSAPVFRHRYCVSSGFAPQAPNAAP